MSNVEKMSNILKIIKKSPETPQVNMTPFVPSLYPFAQQIGRTAKAR